MAFDPSRHYPLGSSRPDLVRTPGGLPLHDLSLHGENVTSEELRATPETLRLQAGVARAAGRAQLADNLLRAAELASIPDETILEIYTALHRSARFIAREARGLRKELLIEPLAELGLVAMNGPNDPEPSLVLDGDRVVELDGRREEEWDALDYFVARYGLDAQVAREASVLEDVEIARRLVDVSVPRDDLVRLSRGLTPARLARVVGMLDPVELMFAMKKLRARRRPANQAHVTNLKKNPALLAADAAEAAARGFAEVETTVGVSRYAGLNAIAILVGSQTGRPGVMTQCAVEERLNLRLGMQGLVTYAETLSVYGTEPVFVDGDDTPWSKAFLGSAYASRGIKIRFTSGGGSEALMGESEGRSMLYLEARCLSLVRAAGSQGVQNGSISCIALALSVPGGTREVLSESVHDGARLSGSGIAVGLQSKGTALIHRADLEPLDNLELFGMAPSLTLDSYRQIGRNAAGYALGKPVAPVPTVMDNYARAKLIVRITLLHARETATVVRNGGPVELAFTALPISV